MYRTINSNFTQTLKEKIKSKDLNKNYILNINV